MAWTTAEDVSRPRECRYSFAMISRRRLLQGGVASLALPAISATGAFAAERLHVIHRMAEIAHPHRLTGSLAANLVRPVAEPLLAIDPLGALTPRVIAAWRASDDLTRWDLSVDRERRWRDGRRVTAEDVAWNLRRLVDPAASGPGGWPLRRLVADDSGRPHDPDWLVVTAPGRLTLRLQHPSITLPVALAAPGAVLLDPGEDGRFGPGANGTGPYRLTDAEPGRFAAYRSDRAAFAEVLLEAPPRDPARIGALLKRDRVDGIHDMDLLATYILGRFTDLEVHIADSASTAVMQLHLDAPALAHPEARRAIRMALSGQGLVASAGRLGLTRLRPAGRPYLRLAAASRLWRSDTGALRSRRRRPALAPHGFRAGPADCARDPGRSALDASARGRHRRRP